MSIFKIFYLILTLKVIPNMEQAACYLNICKKIRDGYRESTHIILQSQTLLEFGNNIGPQL